MNINNLKHFLIQKVRSIRNEEIIYFISFPKSGRTWLEVMMAKTYSELTGEKISDTLNKNLKFYKNRFNNKKLPYIEFGHGYKNAEICLGNYFPSNYYKNKKIILLVRDPRDIIISLFYHDKYFYDNFDGELNDFVTFNNEKNAYNSKSKRYGINAIINYLNAWIENKKYFKDFKIIFYENMKINTKFELENIFNFLKIEYDDLFIEKIISFGSFENMKKYEKTDELNWYGLKGSGAGAKIRKGKVGGYKNELNQKNIEFLNNSIKTNLNPFLKDFYLNQNNKV